MTPGERLYACLLELRRAHFQEWYEGIPEYTGTEPRVPWAQLDERQQWSQAEWEKIAVDFNMWDKKTGMVLYWCVLKVCPMQRRVQSGIEVSRQPWHRLDRMRQEWWDRIAEMFAASTEGSSA